MGHPHGHARAGDLPRAEGERRCPQRATKQIYDNRGQGNWHDNPGQADTLSKFQLSGLRWHETVKPWMGGEIVGGVDVDQMQGSVAFGGFTAFDGTSMRLVSPHIALSQTVALTDGWQITPSGGVRLYRHDVYENSAAPHVGLVLERGVHRLARQCRAGGNHPGLDAPLLNAIVPPLGASPASWRNLDPECMNHVELGARWTPGPAARSMWRCSRTA